MNLFLLLLGLEFGNGFLSNEKANEHSVLGNTHTFISPYLLRSNTLGPLGKLEVVLVTGLGSDAKVVLQGVAEGTSANVSVLEVAIMGEWNNG